MKYFVKGFTLIELMIVVTIVAILATIAVPAYQTYIGKAQLTEAFALSAQDKTALEIYMQSNGLSTMPEDIFKLAGLSNSVSGKYITKQGAYIEDNHTFSGIVIFINNNAVAAASNVAAEYGQDAKIFFNASFVNGQITWNCESNMAQRYLPPDCLGDQIV